MSLSTMSLSTSHAVFSKSNVETVWKLWDDVKHWSKWDSSIEKSSLKKGQSLALNTECILVVHGNPEPIIARVTEFTLNKSFTTQNESDLGTITLYHEVTPLDQGVTITHKLTFDGKDERTKQIFEKNIWPNLTKGFTKTADHLAKIAESKKMKKKRDNIHLEEAEVSTEINKIKNRKIEHMSLSTSHTAFSKSDAETVWALWSDVANWPKWDFSLEKSNLKEGHDFKKNAECILTVRDNPTPINTCIIELTLNKSYTTQNNGDLGVVTIYHDVTSVDNGVNITHRLIFDPKNEHTKQIFEQKVWPNISKGLVGAVDSLARMSEKI